MNHSLLFIFKQLRQHQQQQQQPLPGTISRHPLSPYHILPFPTVPPPTSYKSYFFFFLKLFFSFPVIINYPKC